MASKTRLLGRLLCLLLYSQTLVLAVETVSQFGEKWSHPCVERCLGRWAALYDNIGSALQCASPFYNECYCATAAASASKATSYLASCASTSCKAGDITMDLSAMQSLYASYCMENGFTQPGATAWYNPSATETGAPAPGSTTTRLSVVTQTIASDSGGDSSTQPWVIVDATSTVWVDAAGSIVPAPSSDRNQNTLALGLGLGLGIPLALAIAGFGTWICIRRRRRSQSWNPNVAPLPTMVEEQGGSQSPNSPKPLATTASGTQSLSGAYETQEVRDQGMHPGLGGTWPHPFPDVAPGPPVSVPEQHELHGLDRQIELPGGPPPQYYQPAAVSPGTPTARDRWEMP